MKILRHIENRRVSLPKPVVTLGNFDGIHLGHQALLRGVVEDANSIGGCSAVLTFEPHPLKILAPHHAPRLILTHRDKMFLLRSYGVQVVIIQAFNEEFANIEPGDFVQRYLVGGLKVRKIWVGRDFGFGKGKKGRVEDLIRWGAQGEFEVGVVERIEEGGVRVSSSHIRQLIERGEVDKVRRYLGRYHFVSGWVGRGHQRGRELGFPTANIVTRTEVVPVDGIYATFFEADGKVWPSVTNIGHNPTFGGGARTVETYIFDFEGDLYRHRVRLFFIQRIREERKFSSAALLVEEIKRDVATAKNILGGLELPLLQPVRGER